MTHIDPITARIIDANLNRAREALRVMEDFSRLGLEDATLSADLKEARHELASAMPPSLEQTRIVHRDIIGDVGRTITGEGEYERPNREAVVRAACSRLTEALRCLEEYGKEIDRPFAKRMETLRYQAYDLERRLQMTARSRKRFGCIKLYVILTEALCRNDWLATAEAALAGGADALQLREKNFADRELVERVRRLADVCRSHEAMLIVNDRPDIAMAGGADGVHLGQDDLDVQHARRIVLSTMIVGVSTHTSAQVEQAARKAPDYLAVGPIFPSATKPQDHIAGPETLANARQQTGLPLVAIGGIDETNVAQVLAITSCAVCVCSAVISQADVRGAAERMKQAIEKARQVHAEER